MKLKKFRIKNYKSIEDSGDCYLTDTITIFAGKNESGKTSILEALADFDTNKEIQKGVKPIKSEKAVPEISITFVIKKDALKQMMEEIKIPEEIKSPAKVTNDIELEIIKVFPDKYTFGKESLTHDIFGNKEIDEIKESINRKWEKVQDIRTKYKALGGDLFEFKFSNLEHEKVLLTNFMNVTEPNLDQITDQKQREHFFKLLSEIHASINCLTDILATKSQLLEVFKKKIPNFIFFDSFNDVFPNKIPLGEVEKNEWVKDLRVISDLNTGTIKGENDRGKEKHRDDVNLKLNEDYKKFWTQDLSNLSINWDSQYMYFWIKEGGYSYEPTLRSKGRQWHLAFYIKVSARSNENKPNIILIDEPGLFLHAKAQKDILGKLEDSSKEVQLVFSTHSPYLLEADKLNRVRLVLRNNKFGTRIENKVHASADKETLTPILNAIGLELNAGISSLDKKDNVIVEGASDVFYLDAFKRVLKKDNVNFIFGGGSGNMPFVGTILHGWGGNVVYLYDNDQGKKDGVKNLKSSWIPLEDSILSISDTKGSIEDIFSQSDFKKFVLSGESENYTGANSEYVKKAELNKVCLAREFLEKCQKETKISLDKTTTDRITKIFKRIEGSFLKNKISKRGIVGEI